MKRIAIIGSPGAGKTTLAKHLGQILKIKVYHLDRYFWQNDWQSVDGDTRIDIMQSLARESQWIIEGTYLRSSGPRLSTADTIIFLDTNPFTCLYRIIHRHHIDHGRSRRDIPDGCGDKLTLERMWKVLSFPIRGRRILIDKLHKYDYKQIIRLRSAKEVEAFLADPEQYISAYSTPPKPPTKLPTT